MSNKCLNSIVSNPDIAGIGIRVSFYATLLLTSLTPENDYTGELLDGIYTNSVINGLGLVITAVVQTIEKQLDLYHAIFVMQIIFSLNFVYAYGQRRLFRSTKTDFRMKIFIWVQNFTTGVFTIWLLYVWIKDSSFGSQPSCNDLVKYVLFFASVRATVAWLRVLFLLYLVITACGLLFSVGVIVSNYYAKRTRLHNYEKLSNEADAARLSGPSPSTQPHTPQSQGQPKQGNDSRRTELRYYGIPSLLSAVYGVATLELIAQRNHSVIQPGENAWGFGQIIALIVTLGSLIDIAVAVRYDPVHRSHQLWEVPLILDLLRLPTNSQPTN